MTQQIKKRLSALSILGIMGVTTFIPFGIQQKQTEISEVAEQKSVIDEQAMTLPLAGVSLALVNSESLASSIEVIDTANVSSAQEVTEELEYRDGWTNASVNVRTEPSTDSEILEIFKYNTKVLYAQATSEWSQIKYGENIAYIKTEYISDTINPSLSPYVNLIDSLTDDEKYLLYQITYAESGNQCMEGQRAVIEVILNRVMSDEFPDTIYDVLSQPGQFETWGQQDYVVHNEEQEKALQLVYSEAPILNTSYLMFSLEQFSWANNYVKIEDVWFGTF